MQPLMVVGMGHGVRSMSSVFTAKREFIEINEEINHFGCARLSPVAVSSPFGLPEK